MSTDSELANRCLQGRAEAMRELVERFQSDVFGLSVRMLGHCQDAEDVTQEVFLRVFRSLTKWDASRPLKPWILAIAVNRCRTCIGKRKKLPESIEYAEEISATLVEPLPNELLDAIRQAVANLREEYREVFILFHEQGLSYEDIADVLNRPVGTVKTWLHRARTQMLSLLQQAGFATDDPIVPETSSIPARRS